MSEPQSDVEAFAAWQQYLLELACAAYTLPPAQVLEAELAAEVPDDTALDDDAWEAKVQAFLADVRQRQSGESA